MWAGLARWFVNPHLGLLAMQKLNAEFNMQGRFPVDGYDCMNRVQIHLWSSFSAQVGRPDCYTR